MAKAQVELDRIPRSLREAGFADAQIQQAQNAVEAAVVPEKTYTTAVLFLGIVTLVLGIGTILLAALNRTLPEGLWVVLGAGIGGLAGIFKASKD
jgi:hypothetical protein